MKIEEAVERLEKTLANRAHISINMAIVAATDLRLLLDAYAASKGVTHYYVETCPHCGGKLEGREKP